MPSPHKVVIAYRNFYRHVLHAVQYSKPARYAARDHLRNAFRNNADAELDANKVKRTLTFLHNAARVRGLEHKIVKNLLNVWVRRQRTPPFYL